MSWAHGTSTIYIAVHLNINSYTAYNCIENHQKKETIYCPAMQSGCITFYYHQGNPMLIPFSHNRAKFPLQYGPGINIHPESLKAVLSISPFSKCK